MRLCALCKKKFVKGSGSFFRVPKDITTREKWGKICKKNFAPSSLLCSDHFPQSSIICNGNRKLLMPNTEPCIKETDVCGVDDTEALDNLISEAHSSQSISEHLYNIYDNANNNSLDVEKESPIGNDINVASPEDFSFEKHTNLLSRNSPKLNNNVILPQFQEEPIIQIPIIKSVSCTGSTQTNTRLCGLVQASDFPDEFRFNCFYCSGVYPLEKWKDFVIHLKTKHSDIEEAFKKMKYVSDEHDYTPINPEMCVLKNEIKTEPLDPLDSSYDNFVSMEFKSPFYYPENDEIFENKCKENNFVQTYSSSIAESVSEQSHNEQRTSVNKGTMESGFLKQTSRRTALSRCLKRTIEMEVVPEENEQYNSISIEIVQQKPTEVSFEYTPPEIINLLLDNMKDYPVLWQFDDEPFNEDFYEAVGHLCKIINEKWPLNIDNLKMRRSVNRILRFYCSLYPNTNVENIDQFTCFYDKCAAFLPSSVSEIAYARCSHCYTCYKNDFDLKRHLLKEQKYLQWPHKCVECKECFREEDEYEFHKLLPHYNEIFRCELCNKSFRYRNIYNKHMSVYHERSSKKHIEHKCDVCGKVLQTRGGLQNHKMSHGERIQKCHLCPKSFFVRTSLLRHIKTHGNEYDFVCEVCGKKFLIQQALKKHMKQTHEGARVHCSICNLRLRKSSLSRHIRVVHMANEGSIEKTIKRKHIHYRRLLKPKLTKPIKRKGGKRKYYCKICKIDFEHYKLIVEHNKELHSDMPRWPCKMCDTEFSLVINLKKHYRKKHNLHVIQVFKLVNENEDLDTVLDMEEEYLDKLSEILLDSNNKPAYLEESITKTPTKSDLLSDEIFFEAEKMHSSTLQDEIMKADNIVTEGVKIDYMNDLFTDLLKDQQKNIEYK